MFDAPQGPLLNASEQKMLSEFLDMLVRDPFNLPDEQLPFAIPSSTQLQGQQTQQTQQTQQGQTPTQIQPQLQPLQFQAMASTSKTSAQAQTYIPTSSSQTPQQLPIQSMPIQASLLPPNPFSFTFPSNLPSMAGSAKLLPSQDVINFLRNTKSELLELSSDSDSDNDSSENNSISPESQKKKKPSSKTSKSSKVPPDKKNLKKI